MDQRQDSSGAYDVISNQLSQPASPDTPPETLPLYESAPAYAAESFFKPLVTYHLRVTKSNLSHLVSFAPAPSNAPVYAVKYRSTTALFNRKGDISISRKPASSPDEAILVARADFRDNGTLPYCPRARLSMKSDLGEDIVLEMEAQNWKNWTFAYGGESYIWTLRDVPACIELSSSSSSFSFSPPPVTSPPPVIARFMYGPVGTKVGAGGEAGQLDIWRDGLTETTEGRDIVVAGCLTAVKYFDGLGRRFRNDGFGGGAAGVLINAKGQERNRVRNKIMLF